MAETWSYHPLQRTQEVISILLFVGLGGALAVQCGQAFLGPFARDAWWLLPTALLLGYLIADFVSGAVHWLADNFGHEQMPVIGAALIKPFREHHVDPRGITRHDFIETNGNNCLVCWPWLLAYWLLLDPRESIWVLAFLSTWLAFNWGIFATNQFHKWAHLEEPPPWIAWLQDHRLILSPEHHDIHHTPPFERYYCITTGWLNPILCDRLRFFQRLEALIRWAIRSPKAPPAVRVEAPAQLAPAVAPTDRAL
jgi:plasmanylethanolamine desaturase